MNKVADRIKRYRELKADIVDIDIRIQELEEEMIGISAQPSGERTSNTYKITSIVEVQVEKYLERKEKLLEEKARKEREIKRIDNAMTVLNGEEYIVIKTVLIGGEKWWKLEEKLHKSYRRLKYIEQDAIKKMKKYFI